MAEEGEVPIQGVSTKPAHPPLYTGDGKVTLEHWLPSMNLYLGVSNVPAERTSSHKVLNCSTDVQVGSTHFGRTSQLAPHLHNA
jgi:hypothetical protein